METKDIDVLVVGSIIMDLICYSSRIPKLGETIEGSDFKTGFGGKGANQCVAAARLGATCAFVGKIGDDANGQKYYANLTSEGINVDAINVENGAPTGVASIMVGENDGQNIIVIVPGANKSVTPEYVREFGEAYIKRAKVVIVQLEIPIVSSLLVLQLAKQYGATSIFNVAPASRDVPMEMFALPDIICLNETETELVTGLPKIASQAEAKGACQSLVDKFSCNNIIITLGSQGAVLWDSNDEKLSCVDAPTVKAIDTTGAGDCFVGTLAFCLSRGESLASACQKAILNSSDSVLRKGTQSSFPSSMIGV